MASFVKKITEKVGEVKDQVAGNNADSQATASATSLNGDSSNTITDGLAGVSLQEKKKITPTPCSPATTAAARKNGAFASDAFVQAKDGIEADASIAFQQSAAKGSSGRLAGAQTVVVGGQAADIATKLSEINVHMEILEATQAQTASLVGQISWTVPAVSHIEKQCEILRGDISKAESHFARVEVIEADKASLNERIDDLGSTVAIIRDGLKDLNFDVKKLQRQMDRVTGHLGEAFEEFKEDVFNLEIRKARIRRNTASTSEIEDVW